MKMINISLKELDLDLQTISSFLCDFFFFGVARRKKERKFQERERRHIQHLTLYSMLRHQAIQKLKLISLDSSILYNIFFECETRANLYS
jgi:hypothetical protein